MNVSKLPIYAMLGGFCVLLPAGPVVAQQQETARRPEGGAQAPEIEPSLQVADLKLGPFYAQLRVGVKDFGWDSNILGTVEADDPSGDFRATPLAGLKLLLPIRNRHILSVDGEVDYQWFRNLEDLRGTNTVVGANYEYLSDRWSATLQNRFVNGSQGLLDRLVIDDLPVATEPEILRRVDVLSNVLDADVRWNLTTRSFINARGARRVIRYDDAAFSIPLDRIEESLGGTIGYRVLPKTAVGLAYDVQINDYDSPDNIREAEIYRVTADIEIESSALISGDLRVGYARLRPRAPDIVDYGGFLMQALLRSVPFGFLELTLTGEQDIFPSSWFDSIYGLRQGGSFGGLIRTSSTFGFGGDVSYYEHTYPEETTAPVSDGSLLTARRRDRLLSLAGRISTSFDSSGTVDFRVGYYRRESNYDLFNANGLFVGTGYAFTR